MRQSFRLLIAAAGLASGLALAASAWADPPAPTETPTQELTAVFRCAAAMGIYQGFTEDPASVLTEGDKTLAAGLAAVEPRLRTRGEALAASLGEEATQQIIAGIKADLGAQIEPLRAQPNARGKVIDLFRPVLAGCVDRGGALPTT